MLAIVLAILVTALAALTAAGLGALIKGYFELRRNLHQASDEFGNILLKTPGVPGVSVIVVPTDASAASRALVRRLLNLHYGNHEVVLVLEGLTSADFADVGGGPAAGTAGPRLAAPGARRRSRWSLRVAGPGEADGGPQGLRGPGRRVQCRR
jgi:hypothetical protein